MTAFTLLLWILYISGIVLCAVAVVAPIVLWIRDQLNGKAPPS